MNNELRGTIIQQGNTMRINNALVEDVSCVNNSNGFILVSYAVCERNNSISMQNIRLNVNRNTIITNSFGQSISLCSIQRGSWVNAVFSSRTTMSIPPQSNAFLIMVQRGSQLPRPPQPPRPSSLTTTGRIVLIDFDNNYLITEDLSDPRNQTKFIITNNTTFKNRFGNPISFNSLQPGQIVRITHANFQTHSFPPQTTAFNIRQI